MVVRQYGSSEEVDLNNSSLSSTSDGDNETSLGASLQSDDVHDRVWGIDNTVKILKWLANAETDNIKFFLSFYIRQSINPGFELTTCRT